MGRTRPIWTPTPLKRPAQPPFNRLRNSPDKGLTPYDENDAMFFFGREVEQDIFIANLRAYPLTVLYGATGVGKTSLLRAGVAHSLGRSAAENIAERGVPELAIAVVSNWRGDPLSEL